MKKILITGSKGSIGTNLVPYLKEEGHEVIPILSDIRDYKSLRNEVLNHKDVDWVVHLAAIVNTVACDLAGRNAYDVNVTGTHNIAELTKEIKAKFCYFSTTAIYKPGIEPIYEDSPKEPDTLYGFTKYLGELTSYHLFKEQKDKLLIIRPCFAFGSNLDDHSIGTKMIISGFYKQPLTVLLNPEYKKDYMYVLNLSEATEMLLSEDIIGDFNISYGEPIKFGELIDYVKELGIEPFLYLRPELDYMKNHIISNDKLKKTINWKPTVHVKEGMEIVLKKLNKKII